MYNNPFMNQYNPQATIDKLNEQINNLEKMKSQIQQPPQPAINQTFQLAPTNREVIRYASSMEEVQKDMVIGDTPYFSKDMSVVWIKNTKGEIRTYELNEIVPLDEKDLKIQYLETQIEELKKGMSKNVSNVTNDDEKQDTTNTTEYDEPIRETIINEPLALPSNASPVTFDETTVRTRCASCCGWLDYSNGNPNFKIFGNGYTGYYDVEFSASVSTATAGVVAIGLYQDGVLIPDTVRAVTIAAADDYETISFDKKLRVCPRGTTNISVQSVPSVPTPTTPTTPIATTQAIITNATFSISRLNR